MFSNYVLVSTRTTASLSLPGSARFQTGAMPLMKEDLKLLLNRNGVHEDVTKWLSEAPQDCHEIKHFANMATKCWFKP